ncbi:MAG: hypothetical protein LBJ10_01535, partial [Clostridiales bacterium]|nr:hypothetical protein [Clostridiales bacterium]
MLRTHKKDQISVITLHGKMSFSRYILIPQDAQSKKKLMDICGQKTVVPLDAYLGLAYLPFKISPCAMLKIAYWAQTQSSYQRAEDTIREVMRISINDDTVRQVANFVGRAVFENDCRMAENAFSSLESGELGFPYDRDGTLYIQTDGA